jgi:ATP-dependent RNA helicase DDX54/DBP10
MPTSVRPRVASALDGELLNTSSDEETCSDHSFDLSSTLTRKPLSKKGKGPLIPREDDVDDDTELEEMIRRSITRRNVKDGTELLKNTKGKKRLTKGEVGGGSFQSMGTSAWSFVVNNIHNFYCTVF